MSEPIRLAKRVAELTGCSRSEAEQYIEGGWVTVDGETVEAPQHPVTDERVEIDPAAELGAAEPAPRCATTWPAPAKVPPASIRHTC